MIPFQNGGHSPRNKTNCWLMGTTGMKYSLAYNLNWELFFCYFPQMYEGNQAKKSSYFEGSSNFTETSFLGIKNICSVSRPWDQNT